MKRVICFDLWETLIRSSQGNGASYEDVLVRLGAKREDIYPIVRDRLMTHSNQYVSMASLLCCWLGLQWEVKDAKEAARLWQQDNEQVDWILGANDTIRELKKKPENTLVLVTNITRPAWDTVARDLNLLGKVPGDGLFRSAFVSCLHGFCKPDRRVWTIIVEHFDDVGEYWMIGDNKQDDLAVPAAMGWKTILVNHPDGVSISEVTRIIGEAK